MRRLLRLALCPIIGLCWMNGACTNDEAATRAQTYGAPVIRETIQSRTWVLDRLHSSLPPAVTPPVTLTIAGSNAAGSAGCNAYSGTFTLDRHTVRITNLTQTMMACDPPVMQAEDAYLAALRAVDSIQTSANRMELSNARGVQLVFDADASMTPVHAAP